MIKLHNIDIDFNHKEVHKYVNSEAMNFTNTKTNEIAWILAGKLRIFDTVRMYFFWMELLK